MKKRFALKQASKVSHSRHLEIFFSSPPVISTQFYTITNRPGPPPSVHTCSVAVVSSVAVWSSHLSTNRMGFCFFQSKCVVIVSSSCDFPTRGGLQYEFCSFQCPDRVEDLCMKHFWSVFPDGFWRILQKFEVCSKLSSVNAYFHMLESQKAWDKDESTIRDFEEGQQQQECIFERLR